MGMTDNSKPMTIDEAQQKDFIWTWKSNARGAKASLWLPYFSRVEKIPRTKNWLLDYNGGQLIVDLNKIDFIMFYGATGELSLEFLDSLAQHGIVFMIHRRNQMHPYVFYPPVLLDKSDILSRQIIVRSHEQKRAYIAKVLIKARLDRFAKLSPVLSSTMLKLRRAPSVDAVRAIEAIETARYWKRWFASLGAEGGRRDDGALQTALDAGSRFLHGVLLRWILFHKLSPAHGFLHEPTGYQSLVYDLIEPYRYTVEDAVAKAWRSAGDDEKKLVAASISKLKMLLDEIVYVPATRQFVRRKNLLHGGVLALRSYLAGESRRFVIPVEGEKKGGRPPKVVYKLPGEVR